ncbi:MAG TPA: DUF2905 domain-containing protein [Ignavibacteriaceae bacterium]
MSDFQKILIILGILLLIAGLTWPWISKLPFGKLPGDIVVDRPGFKFYFPIISTIIISAVISFVLWLIKKL